MNHRVRFIGGPDDLTQRVIERDETHPPDRLNVVVPQDTLRKSTDLVDGIMTFRQGSYRLTKVRMADDFGMSTEAWVYLWEGIR